MSLDIRRIEFRFTELNRVVNGRSIQEKTYQQHSWPPYALQVLALAQAWITGQEFFTLNTSGSLRGRLSLCYWVESN